MSITFAIAILSTIIQLIGYGIYNRSILSGHARPNVTSWLIWGGVSILNTSSYITLSHKDFVVGLLPLSITIVNLLTLCVIAWKSSFKYVKRTDVLAFVVALTAVVAWKLTSSPSIANLMVQAAIIIGTIPTLISTWREPTSERPLPWFLWSFSFALAIIVISLRPSLSWVAFVSPAVQFILYVAIGAFAGKIFVRNRQSI